MGAFQNPLPVLTEDGSVGSGVYYTGEPGKCHRVTKKGLMVESNVNEEKVYILVLIREDLLYIHYILVGDHVQHHRHWQKYKEQHWPKCKRQQHFYDAKNRAKQRRWGDAQKENKLHLSIYRLARAMESQLCMNIQQPCN